MPGKCAFNDLWVNQREIWLCRVENDKHKAYCKVCRSQIDVSHSGINAVKVHEKGKKHVTAVNGLKSQPKFTCSKVAVDVETEKKRETEVENPGALRVVVCKDLNKFTIPDKVTEAEILWALHVVYSHISYRCGGNASDLFKLMFPDSVIAEKFSMHKDKVSYICCYGLGPHFQDTLVRELSKSDFFCLSLDESLNKISQTKQMDIIVRYFDCSKNEITSRYLTSTFLGHSTAKDLLESFTTCLSNLGLSLNKVIQIETDGPNVNLKFLRDFADHVKEEFDSKLLDIGTCSLHIVHGVFKTAHKQTKWEIHEFLRCIYYLFKDFPSRRADYQHYSGSSLFPLKLCAIRWVENSRVLERAIKVLPSLKLYADGVGNSPPSSKNFGKLLNALNDDLLLAKLHFMQSIAAQLETFLIEYQSEKPLLPFLYADLCDLLKSIASRFLKPEVVAVKNLRDLLLIEICDKNLLTAKKVDIGFGAANQKIPETKKMEFYNDCRAFLISLFENMRLKSPINKILVKGASCLSPDVMISGTLNVSRINLALNEFVKKKQMTAIEADSVKATYLKLCENVEVKKKLSTYSRKLPLDVFLLETFDLVKPALGDKSPFIMFVKKILALFHGNAAVERGFSINAECLIPNLENESLVGQRSIHSAVSYYGGVNKVPIDKSMLASVRHASRRRQEALAQKKEKQNSLQNDIKNATAELKELKKRKLQIIQQAKEEEELLQKQIEVSEKRIKTAML